MNVTVAEIDRQLSALVRRRHDAQDELILILDYLDQNTREVDRLMQLREEAL